MLLYCLKSIKNTGSKNAKVARIKSGRIMLLSNYVIVKHQSLLKRKNLVGYSVV